MLLVALNYDERVERNFPDGCIRSLLNYNPNTCFVEPQTYALILSQARWRRWQFNFALACNSRVAISPDGQWSLALADEAFFADEDWDALSCMVRHNGSVETYALSMNCKSMGGFVLGHYRK